MRWTFLVLVIAWTSTATAGTRPSEIKRGGDVGADCVLRTGVDAEALDLCVTGAKRQALVANTATAGFKLGLFFEAMVGAATLHREAPSNVTKSSVSAYAAEVSEAEKEMHIGDAAVAKILRLTSPAAASAIKDARDVDSAQAR